MFSQPTIDQQQQIVRLWGLSISGTGSLAAYPPWDFLERKNRTVEILKEFIQVAIDWQTMLGILD